MPVNPAQSTVDEMNGKLDYILSQLAKTVSPPGQTLRFGRLFVFRAWICAPVHRWKRSANLAAAQRRPDAFAYLVNTKHLRRSLCAFHIGLISITLGGFASLVLKFVLRFLQSAHAQIHSIIDKKHILAKNRRAGTLKT